MSSFDKKFQKFYKCFEREKQLRKLLSRRQKKKKNWIHKWYYLNLIFGGKLMIITKIKGRGQRPLRAYDFLPKQLLPLSFPTKSFAL